MLKTRWLLALVLGLSLIGVFVAFRHLPEPKLSLQTAQINEVGSNPTYEIKMEYPQLAGGPARLIDPANQLLTASARQKITEFKNELTDQLTTFGQATSSLLGSFTVSELSTERLSIELDYFTDLVGAAHPNNNTATFNYDLANGRPLSLVDVIGSDPGNLNRLASLTQANLNDQFGNDPNLSSWIAQGAAPTVANYQNFTLTPDNLVVLFDPYQVAPYAAGLIRVKVPWSFINQSVPSTATTTMTITSEAFDAGALIPSQYTCDGANESPPLAVHGVPPATKSLALIVHDPDAVSGDYVHWLAWNLPAASTTTIAPGQKGYQGPCPPSGTHHYYFRVYALDTELKLPPGSDRTALEAAMNGHILAEAELVGLYQRTR